jgi:hypothetical protein
MLFNKERHARQTVAIDMIMPRVEPAAAGAGARKKDALDL